MYRFASFLLVTGCGSFAPAVLGDPGVVPSEARLAAAPSAKPKAPKRATVMASLVSVPTVADTLVLATSWQTPTDDGKGALDSLRVRILGWQGEVSQTWRTAGWTFPSSHTFRELIDYGTNVGGGGTFSLRACVGVWRFGQYAETCSATVNFSLTYPAPPAPGNVGLTVTKVP